MNATMTPKRVGRKRLCSDRVLVYVVDLRLGGASLRGIAARLNAEGVPTPGGGLRWHHSYVDRLLHTHAGKALLVTRAERSRVASVDQLRGATHVGETEKVAAYCRSEKSLRPGRSKNTSPTEADAATFCSSLPQHRTTRRHETGVATAGLVGSLVSTGSACAIRTSRPCPTRRYLKQWEEQVMLSIAARHLTSRAEQRIAAHAAAIDSAFSATEDIGAIAFHHDVNGAFHAGPPRCTCAVPSTRS